MVDDPTAVALLRAVREAPADDTPRLAYADRLEELAETHPTPALLRWRAGIIRAQCASLLAATVPDPGADVLAAWGAHLAPGLTVAQAQVADARVDLCWYGDRPYPLGSLYARAVFVRGFVHAANVPAVVWAHDRLYQDEPVVAEVRLRGAGPTSLTARAYGRLHLRSPDYRHRRTGFGGSVVCAGDPAERLLTLMAWGPPGWGAESPVVCPRAVPRGAVAGKYRSLARAARAAGVTADVSWSARRGEAAWRLLYPGAPVPADAAEFVVTA